MTIYNVIGMVFGLIIGFNIRDAIRLDITTPTAALALIGALLLTFRDFF